MYPESYDCGLPYIFNRLARASKKYPRCQPPYPRCQPPDFCHQLGTPKGVHNKGIQVKQRQGLRSSAYIPAFN